MPYETYRALDLDGDGRAETVGVAVDADGDDLIDGAVFYSDFSGDGQLDTVTAVADTDGDGVMDTSVTSVDADGDGMADGVMMSHDADGDGVADTFGAAFDLDGDGQLDAAGVGYDFNGDGVIDSYSVGYDTDGDGAIDYVAHDYNADGHIDAHGPVGDGGGEGGGLAEALEDACFAAGTLVRTPTGAVPIEALRVGQRVLSWNGAQGRLVPRVITRHLCHGLRRVVRVRIDGREDLVVTPGHRLRSAGRWKRVATLVEGDALQTAVGAARVLAVEPAPEPVAVFNLHTAGEHSFVAGGVIAHNFRYWPRLRAAVHRLLWDPADARRAPRALPAGERP